MNTTPSLSTPCTQSYVMTKTREWSNLGVTSAKMRSQLLEQGCQQAIVDNYVPLPATHARNKQKHRAGDAAQKNVPATPPKAPEPVPTQTAEERAAIWADVESFLKANFLNPDIPAAKVIYAIVASHRINKHAPSWLLPIAPPGSMKTELLKSVEGLPGVHLIDEVTENTFISGELDRPGHNRTAPASLLHRIGNDGIIIVPDFSTILEMSSDKRGKILSQLRRIYDGQLRREFGTSEHLDEREWKGRITLLAGTTPEVDRYYSVLGALGDRFVQLRWSRAGGHEAALKAIEQNLEVAVELRRRVHKFLLPILARPNVAAPEVSTDLLIRLAHFSDFIVHARAHVPRSYGAKEIDGIPQIESNTRLPQELVQIGRGWASLMGRDRITEEDFELIVRAGWDTIPPVRRIILVGLAQGKKPYSLGLADSAVVRQLEDLEAIGLVEKEAKQIESKIGGKAEYEFFYYLSDKASEMLRSAGLLEALKK